MSVNRQLHNGSRLAGLIAYLISPPILPPILFGIILYFFDAGWAEILLSIAISLFFFTLIPLFYVLWMIKNLRNITVELRQREYRTTPFLVGITSYALSIPLFVTTVSTALPLVLAIIACQIVNTFIITLITLRWKISIHTTAIAGFFSILLFVSLTPWTHIPSLPAAVQGIPVVWLTGCLFLIPVVMWARVRSGAHTQKQVWAGTLFGFFIPYLELTVLLRSGLLI